jgi:nucleoside-diphosphate-sugar epimerase
MVLVTGGTGFIGARVTRRLLTRGEPVVCFDLRPDPPRLGAAAADPRLHVVEGDITRFEDLVGAIRQHRVDRIIHTAAVLSGYSQAQPLGALRINVVGTAHLFEAARLSDVARVVYASSMVVHGSQWDHGDRMLDDDAPFHPHTFYAITKVANEATADAYAKQFGLDCRGLRIGAPFGPAGQMGRPGAEVTRLATLAATGQPVAIQLARGESPPSIYVDDVAEILVRLAFCPTLTRPAYLCCVNATPIEDVADMVRGLLPGAVITFGDQNARVTLPYRIDARRLEADIGFRLPPFAVRLRDHVNEVRRGHNLPEIA